MTKEEKIKEAWGEYYNEVKNNIDEDGVMLTTPSNYPEIEFDTHSFGYIQPLALQGIETNNGWVKIESEVDLPKIGLYCHFIIKGFEELNNQGLFDGMFWDNKAAYTSSIVTHYQLIEKPKPPIY